MIFPFKGSETETRVGGGANEAKQEIGENS